jgi:hypothetical protein
VTAAGARRSGAPVLRCPPHDLGVAFPKDLRQRGVAIEDAFIEARQGRVDHEGHLVEGKVPTKALAGFIDRNHGCPRL